MTSEKRTVLITGCSSGFGNLTATTFAKEGWNVIATMRSPEKEVELNQIENVFLTRLDVTDPENIKNAVAEGVSRFGTIHALVNNAGYGGHGLLEQVSDDSIRSMYETNVFGVMNVMKAVLPIMRKQKEGTVINVTSMGGMMGVASAAVYSSSKHAVQGLTESMAIEYKPLNILIKSVLPGAYPTRFNENTDNDMALGDDELTAYAQKMMAHLQGVSEQMTKQGGKVADPQEVADKIYECVTTDTPVHNPVGADADMLIAMMGNAPRQDFIDKLAGIMLPQQ